MTDNEQKNSRFDIAEYLRRKEEYERGRDPSIPKTADMDPRVRTYAVDCAKEMAVNPNANRGQLETDLAEYREYCAGLLRSESEGRRRRDSRQNEIAFRLAVNRNDPGEIPEENLKAAGELFDAIGDEEAVLCAKQCRALAEQARQKAIYRNAVTMHVKALNHPEELEELARMMASIPGYRDAQERAEQYRQEAGNARRASLPGTQENKPIAGGKRKMIIIAAIALAAAVAGFVLVKWILPGNGSQGTGMPPAGRPETAVTATDHPAAGPAAVLTEAPTKEPTAEPTTEPTAEPTGKPTAEPTAAATPEPTAVPTAAPTEAPTAVPTAEPTATPTAEPTVTPTATPTVAPSDAPTAEPTEEPTAAPADGPEETEAQRSYRLAEEALDEVDLEAAYSLYTEAGDYLDAKEKAEQILQYRQACEYMDEDDYIHARPLFAALGDFLGSEIKLDICNQYLYQDAAELMKEGRIGEAWEAYSAIADYLDSAAKMAEIEEKYNAAMAMANDGDPAEAEAELEKMAGFREADEKLYAVRRKIADAAFEAKDYETAMLYYSKLDPDDTAVAERTAETRKRLAYRDAVKALGSGDIDTALAEFTAADDYEDAQEQIARIGEYRAAAVLADAERYTEAREAFAALGDYLDAAERLEACNAALYREARALLDSHRMAEAYDAFSAIADYADSAAMAGGMEADYEAAGLMLQEGKYNEAIAIYEKLYDFRDSTEMATEARYRKAGALLQAGDPESAAAEYLALGSYRDAPDLYIRALTETADLAAVRKDFEAAFAGYQALEQTDEIKRREYELAQACTDAGEYEQAIRIYEYLGQYEYSMSMLMRARYSLAEQLYAAGEYAAAAEQFALLGDMSDSAERAREATCRLAEEYLAAGDEEQARETAGKIRGYPGADAVIAECDYRKACALMESGEYREALEIFETLGDYADSAARRTVCVYNRAGELMAAGEYAAAGEMYASVSYEDSAEKAAECAYRQAEELLAEKQYARALDLLEGLNAGEDDPLVKQCRYGLGHEAHVAGDIDKAVLLYARVPGMPEAQEALLMIAGDYRAVNEPAKAIQALWLIRETETAAATLTETGDAQNRAGEEGFALLAYAAAGKEDLPAFAELAKTAAVSQFDEAAGRCTLLPEEMNFKPFCYHYYAAALKDSGRYEEAAACYVKAGEEKTAEALIPAARYAEGEVKRNAGDWDGAVNAFEQAGDYADSAEQIRATRYLEGEAKRNAGDWDGAVNAFEQAGDYADSAEQIRATRYLEGEAKRNAGDWDGAAQAFGQAGDFADSSEQVQATRYLEGEAKRAAGDWDGAVNAFEQARDYADSAEQAQATRYMEGTALQAAEDWDGAVKAFELAGDYADSAVQVQVTRYMEGKKLQAAGDWDGAVKAFELAGDYDDSAAQIPETRYMEAEARRDAEDWDGAVRIFREIAGYRDAETQITETRYRQAAALNEAGQYAEAYRIYSQIRDYADVETLLAEDENLAVAGREAAEREARVEPFRTIGNTVTFGSFEQDNRTGNGPEKIEWIVLDVQDGKALLLSRYGIDMRQCNNKYTGTTWGTCELRRWLNQDFHEESFSEEEKGAIVLTLVDNGDTQGYKGWNSTGGKDTEDWVFLLSYAEAKKYLGVSKSGSSDKRVKASLTAYARKTGSAKGWWLRSSGTYQYSAAVVLNSNGALDSTLVNDPKFCVRPALWIDLESEFFDPQ